MRTRPSSPSSKSKRKPFRPYILESLEPRRLLTTFTHLVGQAPTSFFFFDEFGHYDRISFFGNVTAEVVGASGGGTALVNLPPAVIGPKPGVNPLDSLFAIYVSQSDLTGGITLAQVPDSNFNATPPTTSVSTPFTGSIGQITILNNVSGMLQTIGAPANSGEALIGAVTNPNANPNPAIPVLAIPLTQLQITNDTFGVLPGSTTTLNAGITVAAGQSLGFCYIGGSVMGQVHFGGAINTFYAGWLLTGNANGETAVDTVTVPQNFTVAGDIQNLLVGTSIGTDTDTALIAPTYISGFDMFANGTIGTVDAGGSLLGSINAAGTVGVPNSGADQLETQFLTGGTTDKFLDGINNPNGAGFGGGGGGGGGGGNVLGTGAASLGLGGGVFANHNSFAQPEYISNNYNAVAGTDNSVFVDGNIQNSTALNNGVDYYAVPLLAGQTITVQVQDLVAEAVANLGDLSVGVFDPDAREIASDYNITGGFSKVTGAELSDEQPFQFTADRPGIYRFAVSYFTNPLFAAQGTPRSNVLLPYVLSILNVGHMTIGSIVAANNVCDNPDITNGSAGFGTQNGDLGAIVSGGDLVSNDDGTFSGLGGSGSVNSIQVENGSLRAVVAGTIGEAIGAGITDPTINVPNGNVGLVETTAGNMDFNNVFADTGLLPPAIGGDYQVVSSAGDFTGDLVTNGNIGTVRMQSLIDNRSAVFQVNAANSNSVVGHIDLIDDAGDLGNDAVGGPSIKVGPNGVLTYLHVLGGTFENALFGNTHTQGQTITYAPGEAVPVVESSGAIVTLTPVVTTAVPAPALTVTTYPLDQGGSAIVSVVSTGGLTVQGSGSTSGQEFGIGSINLQGQGNTITAGTSNLSQTFAGFPTAQIFSPPTLANVVAPLNVIISGSTSIGVLDLTGGNFDEIANNTPGGEIVDINAASIGTLGGSGPIGCNLAHSTAAALLPNTVVSNNFPFNEQRTGVVVSGSVVNVSLPNVGNLIVAGNIGTITGTIKAPVFAGGQINNVLIGSGIFPSGSGNLSNAGIYANGIIGNVVGNNADIRGNVISQTGIQSVHLQNGSIINAQIALYGNNVPLSDSDNLRITGSFVPTGGGTVTKPILTLGSVVTNGSGGIIGSIIQGGDTGVISARNGFGILGTTILNPSTGSTQSIYADGYGIRGDLVTGGFNVGSVTANGDGSLDSTATFSNQVRISETSLFDPFFGFQPNAATDINKFLSSESTTPVNAVTPVVPGVTDTGIIEDSGFFGNHNLRSVNAYSIRSAFQDVEQLPFFDQTGGGPFGTAAAGNGDFTLTIEGTTTGPIPYSPSAAALVSNINAALRTTFGNSAILASGTSLQNLQLSSATLIPAESNGTVSGVKVIATLFSGATGFTVGSNPASSGVGAALAGGSTTLAQTGTTFTFANSIGSIVTTSLVEGMSVVTGKLGKLQTGGDLEHTTLTISGRINNLTVRANLTDDSSIIAHGRNGNIGTLNVLGNVAGLIQADGGKIGTVTIHGSLTGKIQTKTLNKLVLFQNLGAGSLEITGSANIIQLMQDLGPLGNTLTVDGKVNTLKVGSNLTGNVAIKGALGKLQVAGSIVSGAKVTVGTILSLLQVGADFQAGAIVQAHLVKKVKVGGANAGTISIV